MSSSMARIFELDPCEYTQQDIDEVVDYFRKLRAQFQIAESKPKTPKAPKPQIKLDLGDL